MADNTTSDLGGKGLNQAVAASLGGAEVSFTAAIGDDRAGTEIAEALAGHPRLTFRALVRTHPTDESVIWLSDTGENSIVSTARCARSITADETHGVIDGASATDAFLMQGNLSAQTTGLALRAAAARGLVTLFNPAPVVGGLTPILPLADVLICNAVEATALFGAASATAVRLVRPERITVVTLGGDGALLIQGAQDHALPAERVEVCDTTGAGDAFAGTFAAHLHAGATPLQAVRAASKAAATVVTRPGAFSAIAALADGGTGCA